jgi:hypothetical protein
LGWGGAAGPGGGRLTPPPAAFKTFGGGGGGRIAGGPIHTAFVCRVGMAGGPVQEEKGRPGFE